MHTSICNSYTVHLFVIPCGTHSIPRFPLAGKPAATIRGRNSVGRPVSRSRVVRTGGEWRIGGQFMSVNQVEERTESEECCCSYTVLCVLFFVVPVRHPEIGVRHVTHAVLIFFDWFQEPRGATKSHRRRASDRCQAPRPTQAPWRPLPSYAIKMQLRAFFAWLNLIICVFSPRLATADTPSVIYTFPSGYYPFMASSNNGTYLIAAVASGILVYSHDAGLTWSNSDAPKLYWIGLASRDDGKVSIATVNGGGLYMSTDFGVHWAIISTAPTNLNWWGISSSSDGSVWFAVVYMAQPPLYKSTDGGFTWVPVTPSLKPATGDNFWIAISCNHDCTTLYGTNRYALYKSTDGGVTWTYLPSFNTIYGVVSSRDASRVAAVQYIGSLFLSTDAGATSYIASAQGSKLVGVAATSDCGVVFISNFNAQVLKADNLFPSFPPSFLPTLPPHTTSVPTATPTTPPTATPTARPSSAPSGQPSFIPTKEPTYEPTVAPTSTPTATPTTPPTATPSATPSRTPSVTSTLLRTRSPTKRPINPSAPVTAERTGKPTPHSIGHPSSRPIKSTNPTRRPKRPHNPHHKSTV